VKRLIIIGSGGFGREVLGWAKASPEYGSDWLIGGFLDDNAAALEGYDVSEPILGGISNFQPQPDDCFVCALGTPKLRAMVWQRFEKWRDNFIQLIHPEVTIGRNVRLGRGVILCPRVVLTCDLEVGDNTALNVAVAAGHDVRIGSNCQISSFCDITGFVQIGDRVMAGSRASIIPGRKIGADAVIGAGAVVVRHVKPGTTVFGNPARDIF
jgi:sugar O-acyltransferase (sialic acid O-acetyltransferase NeuD family)